MALILAMMLITQYPVLPLRTETEGWLNTLSNRGYTVFQYRGLVLRLDEPRTIPVTLQAPGDCIFGALGGPDALIIRMELMSGDRLLLQCGADDLPLIHLPADSAAMVTHVRLTATDMIHGADAESVYVYEAVLPVDPGAV